MAVRPYYYVLNGYVVKKNVEFKWYPGLSVSQSRKSIASLHEAIGKNILEISRKSIDPMGNKLSAFNLKYNNYPVECVYQSSKQFMHGGPFVDLLDAKAKDAKRDSRLKDSGMLISFIDPFTKKDWKLGPYYHYIYIMACKETLTKEEIDYIISFDGYTDIVFNPVKSKNTQAMSIALLKCIVLEFGFIKDFSYDEFIDYFNQHVI